MGTEKRERQKAGRAARVEAAMAAQKKAESRRRIWWVVGTVAFVAVVLGVLAFVTRDDGDDTASSTATSTTSSLDPTGGAESAAGKPCVAVSEPLPEGAPAVPVEEGPPPTELETTDLVEGTGEPVPAGATVTVQYIGVSCSTGVIFDSSYSRGEPATFPLDQVIPGWTDGIPGMKVGGQRLLAIPSDQAYGPSGRPPEIAPDEALFFVVTMEAFEPLGAAAPSTPAG
jgi:peptidylprolyl isomerase